MNDYHVSVKNIMLGKMFCLFISMSSALRNRIFVYDMCQKLFFFCNVMELYSNFDEKIVSLGSKRSTL